MAATGRKSRGAFMRAAIEESKSALRALNEDMQRRLQGSARHSGREMKERTMATDTNTGGPAMDPPKPAAKPVARMTLVIDFTDTLDTAAQKELLDAVGKFGKVTKATHKVLRAHSRELV